MVSCSILQGADKKLLELSEQRAGGMEILLNQTHLGGLIQTQEILH